MPPMTEVPLCLERNSLQSVMCQWLIRRLTNGSCIYWVESFELANSVSQKQLNVGDSAWSLLELSGEA